ncbi:hypothetical protein NW762_014542 [Fusarium torreyae]|uniref:uracil phosphoribosyltransferase n=1 Tax=Fusarium torreyae TaxID=1237075 RepID=A0A9W8RM44_9HYPO|nr:hypothetical protein NW762_014542 [Fusarium torreyae]
MAASIATCTNDAYPALLTELRDQSLRPKQVRQLVTRLTTLVAKEAVSSHAAGEKVAVIVILRSGMQMTEAFLDELPEDADVVIYHLGLFRDKASLQPVEYYNKLPAKETSIKHAYVLDPLLATGGTITAAINILRDWGVENVTLVTLLASKIGIKAAAGVWPDATKFVTGAIDPEVDVQGHVKPGLGDIGDRLFGTK